MFLCMVRTQISGSDPEIALAQDTRMIIIMNIVSLAIGNTHIYLSHLTFFEGRLLQLATDRPEKVLLRSA